MCIRDRWEHAVANGGYLSVRPSVCDTCNLCLNGSPYWNAFRTVQYSNVRCVHSLRLPELLVRDRQRLVHNIAFLLCLGQNWPTLQRGFSATAELLLCFNTQNTIASDWAYWTYSWCRFIGLVELSQYRDFSDLKTTLTEERLKIQSLFISQMNIMNCAETAGHIRMFLIKATVGHSYTMLEGVWVPLLNIRVGLLSLYS